MTTGSDPTRGAPLGGLRLLDVGDFLAAPVCAMVLGDLGANVIKVEQLSGNTARSIGEPICDGITPIFASGNRGKRSVAIDLGSERGRSLLRGLALRCDVVVHNRSEIQASALGLDYAALSNVRPELIVGSVTAFGERGPYADRRGLDLMAQAMCGMMSVTGPADGPPTRAGVSAIDFGTGLTLAVGVLAALFARERTGCGSMVRTSLLDVGLLYSSSLFALWSGRGEPPARLENRSHFVLSDQFATADGFVVVVIWDRSRWLALCKILDLPDLAADPKLASNAGRMAHQELVCRSIQRKVAAWSTADLLSELIAVGVPCAQTLNLAEASADPQVTASGVLYSEEGLGPAITMVASPLRLGSERVSTSAAPPLLGQHTSEVLAEVLGISSGELRKLDAARVIAQA
jgi:crotonobetainyl-CoA:carnitine CoA-transferase CaiB-like acyl-CoA transferase